MNRLLTRLAAFVGRHWLRVGLIGCALVLLSQKQVNFNVRLGHPASESLPVLPPAPPATEVAGDETLLYTEDRGEASESGGGGGFFSRFNIFGGSEETTRFDHLVRGGDAPVAAFIERFGHVAQAEQQKFGIPASVILATGLLYSRAGNAAGTRDLNNYFGLGCSADWNGATGRAAGECLRRYETAWTSFRDFSLYVTSGSFSRMRQFDARDYRRWSAGLEELGFNAEAGLAAQLQRTIDRYELARFD
ncbi:glucosaminidase domain-containing protein [Lewinella sp. JB7]|uniref:glucosaminidase domain-containing protein n=1 Tax=Lewinella sp. JB7 TaxID=2962887 RepID=UPI0020C9CF75|nr:glucosaminidase domain-containing protein [Lewinella sp. JB7]MCP9236870.1 glucosaminidase domain-containing protein [Lewinella sp. JB7]